jgi:hypothetical protein
MVVSGRRFAAALTVLAMLALPAPAPAQQAPREGGGHEGGGHEGGGPGGHPGATARGGAPHGHEGAPAGRVAHAPPSHAPVGGFARGGHYAAPGGRWTEQPAWRGSGEFSRWRAGHWWTGTYQGRYGSWWVVGPDWYWYPSELAPIPDPYTPPGMVPGYWYWCDAYHQYYPYVGACPSGWRPVQPG